LKFNTLKTVAIFGGTFDPVHNGHIMSALELSERLMLDELRFLPCHRPVHRTTPGCTSDQRLAMVQLAVDSQLSSDLNSKKQNLQRANVLVDDREIKRDGQSYSVETLEQMRSEMGSDVSLIWVMGTDSFASLDQWYRWQDFLTLAHIVVIQRSDSSLPATGAVAELTKTSSANSAEELRERSSGLIWFESLTPFLISATAIRNELAAASGANFCETLSEQVPSVVLDYIQEHRLYR
jgi:nicotinate-nucleotide adenylyltransferase